MQNPNKRPKHETLKLSISKRKIPQLSCLEQQENVENDFHSEKQENIKTKKSSRSKVQPSNKTGTVPFRKSSRKKRIDQISDNLNLNLNTQELKIIEEKENTFVSNVESNSSANRNSVNSIFLKPTQDSYSNSIEINPQCSLDQFKLENWGLPEAVFKKYELRGIKTMFPWQVECLSNERLIKENRNLVYSAPTSAGKTLVAEILILKTVLERQKKVIFILPFVSVVREKMFYFQDLLSDSGIRVEGFMGSITPAGGFQSVNIAIATIEKANSLINRLLEEENLISVGTVVIDELHLLGDPNRGYILELLLTKLRYISLRYEELNIQLIGMSATLPNLSMLADWLNAELYKTDFRPVPLAEQCKIESTIYNRELQVIRNLPLIPELSSDVENIIQLCIETIEDGHSILIFCPTKNWCEKLALQTASAFFNIGRSDSPLGEILKTNLDASAIFETLEQLKRTPTGLDSVLKNTVSFGVAFHHAGLTIDERDIIEGSFRTGSLKVLVATSTLSTGVNLPARRVIIRTPNFHGKPLDTLSYQQMIGRAGRMGKDTAGESILICKPNERAIAESLLTSSLKPIESCLEDSGPLMRSLLEAVASEIVRTPEDLDLYLKCTFVHLQEGSEGSISRSMKEAVQFLVTNEFLILQETEEEHLKRWSATALGKACLAASVPPKEGLFLFEELLKARKCLALDSELHVVYLVTPYNSGFQIGQIDWMAFLEMWSKMSEPEKRVGKLVGVEERFLTSAVRGTATSGKNVNIHKRFYTALALYDLVREIPLYKVCKKFGCCRGLLQSLQQSSSTYAGMITSFCKQLSWSCMELLVAQFQTRLQFGVSRDLMDLLRLPSLNGLRARSLYKEGITSIVELAVADEFDIEKALHKALPFESEKEHNGENQFELARQNKIRTTFITGKDGLTTRQAATLLIQEARTFLQNELGVREVHWEQSKEESTDFSKSSDENVANSNEKSVVIKQKSNVDLTNNEILVHEVEKGTKGTQDSIRTQNYSSNLTGKKMNKSKKDKNSTRNKGELLIEVNKFSQKTQKRIDHGEDISESKINSLVLSENHLPTLHKSVYENIDKEVESALTEVLLNNDELNEEDENDNKSVKCSNLFDSERSVHNCSALEQNILGSLHLSDFEMTNLSMKRPSDCIQRDSLGDQGQEVSEKINPNQIQNSRKSGIGEDMFNSADFEVNFTVEKQSEKAELKKMNVNIDEADLEITHFETTELKTVSEKEKVNTKEDNIEEFSGIKFSDFELTAPRKKDSVETKNFSVKDTLSGIPAAEFELSQIPQLNEVSKKVEGHEEGIKNYLSGINASDFEITKQSEKEGSKEGRKEAKKGKISDCKIPEESKKLKVGSSKTKEKESLSEINFSDFELSKESKKVQHNSKNEKLRSSDLFLTKMSPLKLDIKTNNLKITKKKASSKISQDFKVESENISVWDKDSWDNVHEKKKCEAGKNNKVKDLKNTPKKLIEKRKYSGAEGSPIVSVETYKTRRISVISNDSDSDDMFMPPKKMKMSGQTVINSNLEIQKVEPKNLLKSSDLDKTYFCKPGPSKIHFKNPRTTDGNLIRNGLDTQSTFESSVFSDEESTFYNLKRTKIGEISTSLKLKSEIELQKYRFANVVTNKKMLTLLKQRLRIRNEIALALDCEEVTENKVIIGAKILGEKNSMEDKKSKSEKFAYRDKRICGFAISWNYHALYYVSLNNYSEMKISLKERVQFLSELLTNSSMYIRCFLAKKIYKLLYHCCGIIPSCQFLDPIVADWMLNSEEREKSISYLIAKYYPDAQDYYENCSVTENNPQRVESNSTKEALLIWYIMEVLINRIQEKSTMLLNTFKVEMQVLAVLSRMELRGLGINLPALQELSDVIKREMTLLESKAFFLAGKKFNFMSSSSVAQILGLQKKRKVSTSKTVLEQCTHPISKLIIPWRKLNALQTMMVIPLMNVAQNSRIYGSHITQTVTGRISMHEPNLQNVPKDFSSEDQTFAISLRMAFIPISGNLILSADYCQLELRILAHFANDSLLRSIMRKRDNDIFKSISAKWNNTTEDMVDDKMRQRTKQLCYGMIYGMGTKSLAELLSVSETEAKEFLETFMGTYKGIRSWLSNIVARARVDGYVTTISKRYRMLPGLWSENRSEKSQAERQTINTKIQGSAADITKKAMILIDERLRQEFPSTPIIFPTSRNKRRLRSSDSSLEFRGAYLVLQLHDELLFEVNSNDLQLVAGLIKESMENAYSLEVPLPVKLKVGPAWGDLKEYKY